MPPHTKLIHTLLQSGSQTRRQGTTDAPDFLLYSLQEQSQTLWTVLGALSTALRNTALPTQVFIYYKAT